MTDLLTEAQRHRLLSIARTAVTEAAATGHAAKPTGSTEDLREPRAVFVTLHAHGDLRGCIGSTAARLPLDEAVAQAASDAALHDPRFPPVTPSEVAGLAIEISVLSPFVDVPAAAVETEIAIGRDGVMITRDFARGLLLPQVASSRNWSVTRFLDETCRKAGLPAGGWREGARIQAFSAEVFGESV
jgi:AmmeMemoRadiSam system protein A